MQTTAPEIIKQVSTFVRLIRQMQQLPDLTANDRYHLKDLLLAAMITDERVRRPAPLDLNNLDTNSPFSEPASPPFHAPPLPPPSEDDADRQADEEVASIMAGVTSFPMDTPVKVED